MNKKYSSENLRLILGLKLKTFRLEKGLSLVKLAASSGVAVSYISEIEQGKKYPKPEKMIQLAHGLGISYDDLVSLRVDKKLDPLTALMESELVQEFPFDLFGISARDILNLFSDSPPKASAFLHTILEISRTYDMSVENFLLAALRTYQKLHHNYFPDLEQAAQQFRAEHPELTAVPTANGLREILISEFGYHLDEDRLGGHEQLGNFRSVFKAGNPPTLHINSRLLPSQQAFLLAREIGFLRLGIGQTRPITSSWLKVESFDHLINNFQASYFAGALMLPREDLIADLQSFLAQPTWQDQLLLDLLTKHRATPEMFLYRMSQLLPGEFDLEKLFYLRFTNDQSDNEIRLTKELNLTDDLVPYGLGLREHYCRRWLPLQQLIATSQRTDSEGQVPRIGIQKIRFMGSGNEFLMISLARHMSLSGARQSAMTIGFGLDPAQRRLIQFADDSAIPAVEVNETCERCPLPNSECSLRAAPPVMYQKLASQQAREAALGDLLAD